MTEVQWARMLIFIQLYLKTNRGKQKDHKAGA